MMSSLSETKSVQGKALLFRRVHPLTFPNILPCSKYTPHYHRITPINGIYYNDLRRQIHKDIANQNIVPDYKKRRIIKTSSPPTDKVSSYLQSRNVILSVHVIDQRYLTPQDVLGCFINNTNLNRLPSNCVGVLVAYSLQEINTKEKVIYNLGVILCLHPSSTIIAPIIHSNPSQMYEISNHCVHINFRNPKSKCNIVYLNRITPNSFGDDGYIESSTSGPDVIFDINSFPSLSLSSQYTYFTSFLPRLYTILQPACYKRACRLPFIKSQSMRLQKLQVLNSNNMKTVRVYHRNVKHVPEQQIL